MRDALTEDVEYYYPWWVCDSTFKLEM
jgi:hypothetical protein